MTDSNIYCYFRDASQQVSALITGAMSPKSSRSRACVRNAIHYTALALVLEKYRDEIAATEERLLGSDNPPLYEMPIEYIYFYGHTEEILIPALEPQGITTLGQLAELPESELSKIPRIGKQAIESIREGLDEYGLADTKNWVAAVKAYRKWCADKKARAKSK